MVRPWSPERLGLVLAVPAVLIAGGFTVSLVLDSIRELNDRNQWWVHSYQVLNAANRLVTEVTESESGVRGYLFTQDRNDLASLRALEHGARKEERSLALLVSDSADQRKNVAGLGRAVNKKLDGLESLVAFGASHNLEEISRRASDGSGHSDMNAVYAARDHLVSYEQYLLRDREAKTRRASRWAQEITALAFLTGLGFTVTSLLALLGIGHQRRRFSRLVASIGDGFYNLDRNWRFRYFNPAAETLLGRPASEVLGQPIFEIFPEKLGTEIEARLKMTAATRVPQIFSAPEPVTGMAIEYRMFPIDDGVSVFMHDISRRLADEAEIRRLNASLERRVLDRTAQLEGFCYSIAHDMRMHIRGVSIHANLLAEAGEGVEGVAEQAATLRSSTRRMAALVDDLLAFARTSGKSIAREPVDLSVKAREIAERLKNDEAYAADVQFSIQDGLEVRADSQLVSVVLFNLLDNACKYSSPERPPLVCFGRTETSKGEAFFVGDNGIGFEAEYAERIFQPFERLHSDLAISGSGIGLASVRRIVERHGGEVWAESTLGQGSYFYFTLEPADVSSQL